jgi:3-oxoacyl-(acyl-carrier-protein) synthase
MNERVAQWLRECPLVITGMGAVSAAGASVGALWGAAEAGRSLARGLEFEEGNFAGCVVPEQAMGKWSGSLMRKADRSAQLAVTAAREAWGQSGFSAGDIAPERIAVMAGTSRGPVGKILESAGRVRVDRVLPSSAASSTIASLSGSLAVALGACGPSLTVSAACASAATAIALAAEQLLLGNADVALAGGAEAPLHPVVLAQLRAAGVLGEAERAERICRPFDASRNGTVLGEGAAFLVLETEAGAKRRGAAMLARLSGWGIGAESGERTGISEDAASLVRVMWQALSRAGLSPTEIGYVNAHGTGTELNDRQETVACKSVFGENTPPCSSIKPVTGHCMGAAAALEAVVCIEALRRGILPPTPNWETADPECALDIIAGSARRVPVKHVVSNSSGFWGNNAALIFSKASG